MSYKEYADITASLADLINNPREMIDAAQGMPVAILENSEPVFYCIPVEAWEDLVQIFEYLSRDKWF